MTATDDNRPAKFVATLTQLAEREDRAGLAALRRSLGRGLADPAEAAAVFYRILPPVPEWAERDYWLAAGLFALHPSHRASADSTDHGRPLGAELREVVAREPNAESGLERRFVALLDADRDELEVMLRSIVQLLRQHDQPLDYAQLIRDLHRWNSQWRTVQRRWARAFWRSKPKASNEPGPQSTDVEVPT